MAILRKKPVILRIALVIQLLLLALPVQALTVLPLQGAMRSVTGGPVSDGPYALTVRLYDSLTAPGPLWQDALTAQVHGGLFALELGTPPGKALDAALFQNALPLFVGVQVGADPELPRMRLGMLPRAMWAETANLVGDLECTGCVSAARIASSSIDASKVTFPWASGDSSSGSAMSSLSADLAKDVQCTGCVSASELDVSVLNAVLSVLGGTVSGDLGVQKTVKISDMLDLGSAILSGWKLPTSSGVCDSAHSGAAILQNSHVQVCDGSSWKSLRYCSEICQSPASIACGAAIPDSCGDTGSCAGTGTFCASGQCVGSSCVSYPVSCKAIHTADSTAISKVYTLDPDGPGGEAPFATWCEMGFDGGGWTLAMKVDGNQLTFGYDSPLWTNKIGYMPTQNNSEMFEHKSPAFWTVPFTEIRLHFWHLTIEGTIILPVQGTSLHRIFRSGALIPTYMTRAQWDAVMPGDSLQTNCRVQGINVRTPASNALNPDSMRARIGIIGNNENDCSSPDSQIGVGLAGIGCSGAVGGDLSAGNAAACGSDLGNVDGGNAFVWIEVR